MASFSEMTEDEFLFEQIKSNRSQQRGLMIVYAVMAVAAVVMGIAAAAIGRPAALMLLGIMACAFAVAAGAYYLQYKKYRAALDEIGPNPAQDNTGGSYSAATSEIIEKSHTSASVQIQLFIAYGILGLVMLAAGAFLLLLLGEMGDEAPLLVGGSVLLTGGILLVVMSAKAFRSWRIVRRFEKRV